MEDDEVVSEMAKLVVPLLNLGIIDDQDEVFAELLMYIVRDVNGRYYVFD